ncbi:MAG: hypothetical protein QME51_08165 [Planctomycetota bacterium]|nr:hypothetical protein [Planctomycetota bacterium]
MDYKHKPKKEVQQVKEKVAEYTVPPSTQKYDEKIYTAIKNQDLMLFGIYSIIRNSETCTFERLVAECFSNFPIVFGFRRYPNWPDSLKFDRSLRTLREQGLIVGGMGGKYSPGEISLTEFGEKKAREIKIELNNIKHIIVNRRPKTTGRSIDDKLIDYLKSTSQFKKFINDRNVFSISEPEFRNILRCTLETPQRVLKQNLEYYKNLAKPYNETQVLEFLDHCENLFSKEGVIDGKGFTNK